MPDPKGGANLVANPYKTWNDVNPALPANTIEVLGPPPTSGTRDAFVELGLSEVLSRGRERSSLLEDLFEAVVAAIAIDGGWGAAFDFIAFVFEEDIALMDERTLLVADAKTTLQEAAQSRGLPSPEYRPVTQSGPDHNKMWVYELYWDGEKVARGEGQSKRTAQKQAARRALERLGLLPEPRRRP